MEKLVSCFSYVFVNWSAAPLLLRDRALVPLLTILFEVLGGSSPEELVATCLFTAGVLFLSISVLCCGRGTPRTLSWVLSIGLILAGLIATEFLSIVPVDQNPTLYGIRPIKSLKDYPKLPAIEDRLESDGAYFTDSVNRTILLRGVNLGGDTKVPTKPYGATWNKKDFYEQKEVSFVGRPFPLEEADEHLGRLSSWGLTFLRFLITWEAVEHEGPGIYDTEYLEYLLEVIRKCREYGISVFIDPHQDVWSRWTGGDGAPAWTLEKVGFNLKNLYKSGAAISHQEHGDPFPQMIWPTNYNRLAAATMFTLFFSGNTFAPNTKIDGMNVQDYLQSHYIGAIKQVASMVKDEPNVIGYDTLNEPSNGYAGLPDLNNALFAAPLGWYMSGFDGMVLGSGRSRKVGLFLSPMIFERLEELNGEGVSAWKDEKYDVWRNEGVWDFDENDQPRLLRPNHFALNKQGKPVHFMNDFMVPFFESFAVQIQSIHKGAIVFCEPHIDPNKPVHGTAPSMIKGKRYAWAPHYYDALALILKKSRPWAALDIETEAIAIGVGPAQNAIDRNLAHVKHTSTTLGGAQGVPTLVGEIGIPMDLDRDMNGVAAAYKTGDFSTQIRTLDRTMKALEANLLSFTLWNYAAGNSNKRGDLWNDEDLSLFSRDQQKGKTHRDDLNAGGRAIAAAVRPYPMKTSGIPLSLSFDPLSAKRDFIYKFSSSASNNPKIAPTIIFVPQFQYPNGVNIVVSDGTYDYDAHNQYISYQHDPKSQVHTVSISHRLGGK